MSKGNQPLVEGDIVEARGKQIIAGDFFRADLSTREGRAAARAWAFTYRAEAEKESEGERVYNEIIRLVGEHE